MATFRQKLNWFIGGTKPSAKTRKVQPPRPITPHFDEQGFSRAIEEEIGRQLNKAKDGGQLRLDLRPLFRRWGQRVLDDLASQIGGRGGNLASSIKRSGLSTRARGNIQGFRTRVGQRAGLQALVEGFAELEAKVRELATWAKRTTTSASQVVKELQELKRMAQELEQVARREREAAEAIARA